MTPHRDERETPPKKPARWVSPWSFDDDYAFGQVRHDTAAPELKLSVAAPAPEVRALPKARTEQNPMVTVTANSAGEVLAREVVQETAIRVVPSLLVKSFHSFGGLKVTQESSPTPQEGPPNKLVSAFDINRFQPPQPTHQNAEVKRESPFRVATVVEVPRTKIQTSAKPPSVPELVIPARRPKDVPTSQGHGRATGISWMSPIMLCLGLLGFVLLAWIYLTDTKSESDEDLRTQVPVDQAVKINAPERLKVFLDAIQKIENMELAMKPAWNWDTPSLSTYVQSNGVAFDNLRDLLEDFDWHQHHAAWHAEDLGEHPAWPHVHILLQAQAAYLIRLSNEEAAFTTAIDIAEMSRRMQELWAWPSFMERAQELHMAAVQTTAEILKQTRLSSQRLKLFQDEFIRCEPSDALLQNGLNAFYLHEKKQIFGENSGVPLDTLPGGVTQERPARVFFKKHETLGLFADAFRQLRDEAIVAPYAALGQSSQSVRRVRRPRSLFFQPNGSGEAYFSEHIDAYMLLPERHSLSKARHTLVLCFFAIRRYVADHQKLPTGLTDLSPGYLLDLPMDPFSGEPMQYDPFKGLLFSVGTNLAKEGGKVTQPPLLDLTEPTVDLGIVVAVPVLK